MVIVYGYNRCSTVKKALKFLKDSNIEYTHIDNVDNKLSVDELKKIHIKANVDLKKLFNTSGISYRQLNLKEQYANLNDEDRFKLLANDGKLVKRPILVTDKGVKIGFNISEWENIL